MLDESEVTARRRQMAAWQAALAVLALASSLPKTGDVSSIQAADIVEPRKTMPHLGSVLPCLT